MTVEHIQDQPMWACEQWGQYGHDWLDCPDCIEAYEVWLEEAAK